MLTREEIQEILRVWSLPSLSTLTDRAVACEDIWRLAEECLRLGRLVAAMYDDIERLKPLAMRCDTHEGVEAGCAECYRLEIRRLVARVIELEREVERLWKGPCVQEL